MYPSPGSRDMTYECVISDTDTRDAHGHTDRTDEPETTRSKPTNTRARPHDRVTTESAADSTAAAPKLAPEPVGILNKK